MLLLATEAGAGGTDDKRGVFACGMLGIGDTDHDDSEGLLELGETRVVLLGLVTPAKGGPLASVAVVVVVVVVVVRFPAVEFMTAVSELELVVRILTLAPLPWLGLEVTLKDGAGGLVLITIGAIRFGDGGGSLE